MDAQPPILRRQLGVIAPPGAASVGEHEDALDVIHERRGLGEVGGAGAVLDRSSRSPLRMIRRERPVTSATMSVPKRCTI